MQMKSRKLAAAPAQTATMVQAGYVSVLLPVPPALKHALAARSRETGIIQRDLYHRAIADFVRRHEMPAQGGKRSAVPGRPQRGGYKPLYRGTNAIALRMWIQRDLLEATQKLASRHNIQRREFIYTALVRTFGKEVGAYEL